MLIYAIIKVTYSCVIIKIKEDYFMELINARIKDATAKVDSNDNLFVSLTFEAQCGACYWGFRLTNLADIQRLAKLMDYAGADEVVDLNNKIIRVVKEVCFFKGFGHPVKDKFVPTFTKEFKEVSEVEFKELLNNN